MQWQGRPRAILLVVVVVAVVAVLVVVVVAVVVVHCFNCFLSSSWYLAIGMANDTKDVARLHKVSPERCPFGASKTTFGCMQLKKV